MILAEELNAWVQERQRWGSCPLVTIASKAKLLDPDCRYWPCDHLIEFHFFDGSNIAFPKPGDTSK